MYADNKYSNCAGSTMVLSDAVDAVAGVVGSDELLAALWCCLIVVDVV